MQVNKTEGAFDINPYSKYTLKLFAWEKGTMKPLTDSKTIENLGGSQLTQYLNNSISGTDGDIHYTYYLPEDYDDNKSYPLLITLPGYSSLFNTITTTPLTSNPYADANVKSWTELAGDMIIVSPSLTDWGDKSARQTIELTNYFIDNSSVDESRIYAAGHSAGGETLSRVVDMRPDLFASYLHIASQWDGSYNNVTAYKLPVYIFMGENDEYYGADKAREPYNSLYQKYVSEGLSDDEIDNLLVLDLRDNEYFVSHGFNNQHAGGQLAGNDADIIKWMLSHTK